METPARNSYLWQKATARARFQSHLFTYGLVNGGFWLLWALTPQPHGLVPWPIWSTAFWGFGVLMQGLAVYTGYGRLARTQRAYERLLREQQGDY